MSAHRGLDPAERAAAIAAIDAETRRLLEEVARLEGERRTLLDVGECAGCKAVVATVDLTALDDLCPDCARAYALSDPDAEHREAYYADIAGGCR